MKEFWKRCMRDFRIRRKRNGGTLRITGLVYASNIASKRVLEHNGFIREGLQRNAVFKDGKIYDLCLYGKVK